jgi:superfamily II DNA/RNA helicase
VHRIGRTGRAGKKGKAFTIYEEYDEKNILMIEKVISQKVKTIDFKKISLNSSLKNKKNDTQNNTEIHNSARKVKPKFLPIENFLNFKDSGKIPNFLVSKN